MAQMTEKDQRILANELAKAPATKLTVVDVSYTDIAALPEGLNVGNGLALGGTKIDELPMDLRVNGWIALHDRITVVTGPQPKVDAWLAALEMQGTPLTSLEHHDVEIEDCFVTIPHTKSYQGAKEAAGLYYDLIWARGCLRRQFGLTAKLKSCPSVLYRDQLRWRRPG